MVSGRLLSLSISFLHLTSHLAVLATEFSTYCLSASAGAHSSNAIAIVDARLDCICILSSGPINIFRPSICELNVTPSSFIFLSPASEKTWNPPESVSIGLSQYINLCRPPICFTILSPGLTWRWYVFESSIWQPISFRSVVATAPFMAAAVPTFINRGVCTVPCTVWNSALFALPSLQSILYIFM